MTLCLWPIGSPDSIYLQHHNLPTPICHSLFIRPACSLFSSHDLHLAHVLLHIALNHEQDLPCRMTPASIMMAHSVNCLLAILFVMWSCLCGTCGWSPSSLSGLWSHQLILPLYFQFLHLKACRTQPCHWTSWLSWSWQLFQYSMHVTRWTDFEIPLLPKGSLFFCGHKSRSIPNMTSGQFEYPKQSMC